MSPSEVGDDIKVKRTKSRLIQGAEYYAYGMQTAGSWTRDGEKENNFLANGGTELNRLTGLYDLDYRQYDPVLGRMNQVDPAAAKYASLSPYNFGFNNPVMWNDPMGADPHDGDNGSEDDFYLRRSRQHGGMYGFGGEGQTIDPQTYFGGSTGEANFKELARYGFGGNPFEWFDYCKTEWITHGAACGDPVATQAYGNSFGSPVSSSQYATILNLLKSQINPTIDQDVVAYQYIFKEDQQYAIGGLIYASNAGVVFSLSYSLVSQNSEGAWRSYSTTNILELDLADRLFDLFNNVDGFTSILEAGNLLKEDRTLMRMQSGQRLAFHDRNVIRALKETRAATPVLTLRSALRGVGTVAAFAGVLGTMYEMKTGRVDLVTGTMDLVMGAVSMAGPAGAAVGIFYFSFTSCHGPRASSKDISIYQADATYVAPRIRR